MTYVLLCLIPLLAIDDPGFQFLVQLQDKSEVIGTCEQKIDVKTSFGRAIIDPSQLRSLEINDGQPIIKSSDGTIIKGTINNQFISVVTKSGIKKIPVSEIENIKVVARAPLTAGKITDGVAGNQVTYHIRVPEKYDPATAYNAIVIFHGSNMNSKAYVNTIVSAWPKLAEKYIVIGINGENLNQRSKPDNPAYNYTYVNFAGKSKYGGYPGTDRESPALVTEVISEIRDYVKIAKLFVGGHSQGGFLTYSVMMNYPDMIDGAFPIAGGLIIQAEPGAYNVENLRELQRATPLAIVHAQDDQTVNHSMSTTAHRSFLDEKFPMVRLIDPVGPGHMFARLPIDEAISWLANMSSDDPDSLLKFASSSIESERYRDAVAALQRLNEMNDDEQLKESANELMEEIAAAANPQLEKLTTAIAANQNGEWADGYYQFRNQFEFAPCAQELRQLHEELRQIHQKPADKIYSEARKLFQQNKSDEGWAKYQEIVDQYYASNHYTKIKKWITDREAKKRNAAEETENEK